MKQNDGYERFSCFSPVFLSKFSGFREFFLSFPFSLSSSISLISPELLLTHFS